MLPQLRVERIFLLYAYFESLKLLLQRQSNGSLKFREGFYGTFRSFWRFRGTLRDESVIERKKRHRTLLMHTTGSDMVFAFLQ
ncbi:hypothetical protein [Rubritalea tangerina]|uniref:hypothetical protein n=1 Tax=Rubritalea tangerina TaxID=430798 RepID=UPI00361821F7